MTSVPTSPSFSVLLPKTLLDGVADLIPNELEEDEPDDRDPEELEPPEELAE